jgi:hypothetical protein
MFRILFFIPAFTTHAFAQDTSMTAERLAQIIMDIDPDAAITPSGIELTIEDIPVLVVMAPAADRMRAMVPIASVEDVTPEEMSRMMRPISTQHLMHAMRWRRTVFGGCSFTRLARWNGNSFCRRLPKL